MSNTKRTRLRGGRQSVLGMSVTGLDSDEGMLPSYADILDVTTHPSDLTWEQLDALGDSWAERRWAATPMGQGRAARGNPDLGTFRSKRKAKDLIRESQRRETCETCGNLLDAGRSDARFCSNACKQKHYRATRKAQPVERAKGAAIRYGSAAPMEGVMKPRTIAQLFEVLIESVVIAWKLPYPDVYDEPEWRRLQAKLLHDILREERGQPKPSVTRLRKRLRAKLRTLEQVALQNDPIPSTSTVTTSQALTDIHRLAAQYVTKENPS